MSRFKRLFIATAVALPLICLAAFGQKQAVPARGGGGSNNAIAAYVFGEENARNAEDLSDAIVNNLIASPRYSAPRRGARAFFQAVDREQARNRGRMLDDRNFCRIGGDEGVQFLVIIDIEKVGRGNSVWARILNLDTCREIANAEYTGLIRNAQDINTAARQLSAELLNTRMNKRSVTVNRGAPAAPPPPPPRGNQIAAYVFGMEEARLGPELSDAIVNGLVSHRSYSAPRRGARGFFNAADERQRRAGGRLLEDRDFCRIGTDYEIEFLAIIDIERAGRGNSIWARILDLETCRVIATAESTALVRTDAQVQAVAAEIVRELTQRKIGTRRRGQ